MSHACARPVTLNGVLCALLAAGSGVVGAAQAEPGKAGIHHMNIRIDMGSTRLEAVLEDNPTARDFATLLPLSVTLKDFASAEKITGELPRRLSREGAPAAAAGAVGDIAFYAPWGSLALFYRPGPHAHGLVKIGKITSGIEALARPGPVRVTISRVDQ